MRITELIAKMKELNVDLEKTNPFEFEQKHGLISNTVVQNYKWLLTE